jgi:hypothetical protein
VVAGLVPAPAPSETAVRHAADFAAFGHSHAPVHTAAAIPSSCATTKAGTPGGAMQAKVSDSERAIVTAGLLIIAHLALRR